MDHGAELSSISIPTCLIWGDTYLISPNAAGSALAAVLSNSVLHVVAGGTHMVAHDRPDEIAALFINHLASANKK